MIAQLLDVIRNQIKLICEYQYEFLQTKELPDCECNHHSKERYIILSFRIQISSRENVIAVAAQK